MFLDGIEHSQSNDENRLRRPEGWHEVQETSGTRVRGGALRSEERTKHSKPDASLQAGRNILPTKEARVLSQVLIPEKILDLSAEAQRAKEE